ncbi:MAG: hypothetical protein ACE1ZG_01965, partial [Gammaproteobacteria bacterium]
MRKCQTNVDLPKVLPPEALSLTQRFISTAIGLALVFTPISSSIANELQFSTEVDPGKPESESLSNESLRILYQGTNNVAQAIATKERALVEQFAKENQLTTEWHAVEEEWQLMSALINGHGDIVIGQGESLASGIVDQIKFTYSWGTTRQQVVVRTDTTQIER